MIYCPACSKPELEEVKTPYWRFPLIVCRSCSFIGNAISLKAIKEHLPYQQAAKTLSRDYQDFHSFLVQQGKIRQFLNDARQNLKEQLDVAQLILESHGSHIDVAREDIGFHFALSSSELVSKYKIQGAPLRPALTVVFFGARNLISSLLFISRKSRNSEGISWLHLLPISATQGQIEGGVHPFESCEGSVVAIDDPILGFELYQQHMDVSAAERCPLVLYNPETSHKAWECMGFEDVTLLFVRNFPQILKTLRFSTRLSGLRRISRDDLQTLSRLLSTSALFKHEKKLSLSFHAALGQELTRLSSAETLELVASLDLTPGELDFALQTIEDAEQRQKLREVFVPDGQMRCLRIDRGEIYFRHQEGGLSVETTRGVTHIADVDFSVTNILQGDNQTFVQGIVRYKRKSIPFTTPLDEFQTTHKIRNWLIETCGRMPEIMPSSMKKWADICFQMSVPKKVQGYPNPVLTTADDGTAEIVLPGYIVRRDGVIPENRILIDKLFQTSPPALKEPVILKTYLKPCMEPGDQNVAFWSVAIGVANQMFGFVYGSEEDMLLLVGPKHSYAQSALRWLRDELHMSKLACPGFPSQETIKRAHMLGALMTALARPVHMVLAEFRQHRHPRGVLFPLLLNFAQTILDERTEVPPGSCSCKAVQNDFYHFINSFVGGDVSILKNASARVVCQSFIAPGDEYDYRDISARLACIVFYMERMKLIDESILEPDGSVVKLRVPLLKRKLYKLTGERIELDEYELLETLKLWDALEDYDEGMVVISASYWAALKRGWERSRLR